MSDINDYDFIQSLYEDMIGETVVDEDGTILSAADFWDGDCSELTNY